jgi:hypothetical protein
MSLFILSNRNEKYDHMKIVLFTLFSFVMISNVFAQTLPRDLESTWKVQEGNDRIIEITYVLDRVDDSKYYKIIVRGFVDDRPITMTSLGGDVGSSVRVGKIKTILWQWERDVTEISGELKFVVTQDYSPDAIASTPSADEDEKPASLPLIGHPGVYLGVPAGLGLVVTGLLNSSSAKSDWDAETVRTSETYDPLNKKYKNGQLLSAAGGLVIVGGVVWYIVDNAQYRKLSSDSQMQLEPGYVNINGFREKITNNSPAGVTLSYRF